MPDPSSQPTAGPTMPPSASGPGGEEPDSLLLELVLTTEADEPRARALALKLLESGLAACVSLQPLCSLYRWQGALEESREVQLLIKTRRQQLAALRTALMEHHSYQTPEWIHWSASTAGAYGQWLAQQLEGR